MLRALLLTLLFLGSAVASRAQEDELRIPPVTVLLTADEAYARLLDYLVSNNYAIFFASRADRLVMLAANSAVEFRAGARPGGGGQEADERYYRRLTLRCTENGTSTLLLVGHHTERIMGTERLGPDETSREAAEAFLTAWLSEIGQPSPFPESRRRR